MSSTIDKKSARRCPSKSYSPVLETTEIWEHLAYNLTLDIVADLVEKFFSHGQNKLSMSTS